MKGKASAISGQSAAMSALRGTVKPAPFKYLAARRFEEAVVLKAEHGAEARFLAGGQSLVPMLNFRLVQPAALIDINPIAAGGEIARVDGELRIGALARYCTLEREPRLGELGRLIARIRHDVDGVIAVGMVAPARAAAEHLARQKGSAGMVLAEGAGVADRLLIGRHRPVRRLSDDACEQAEATQQHEGACIGRCRTGPLGVLAVGALSHGLGPRAAVAANALIGLMATVSLAVALRQGSVESAIAPSAEI